MYHAIGAYNMGIELHTRVLHIIRSLGLIPPDSLLVVAVSGGADSLALLHMLNRIKDDLQCRLHVATLDHGLRGQAGADDAQFVEDTAHAWGLDCSRGTVNVNALAAKWKIGIEAAARRARYDFLAHVAHEQGTGLIAVAHNADDQAETVLMHLIRGTGLQGLSGMGHATVLGGFYRAPTIIRPLLSIPRSEIDEYVTEFGLQPRHDDTNKDVNFTRNRIRQQLMPQLREYNPQITNSLAQLANIVAEDETYLARAVEAYFNTGDINVKPPLIRLNIDLLRFRQAPRALQRRYLLYLIPYFQPTASVPEIDFAHIEGAISLVVRGQTGNIYQFPNGIQARLGYQTLYIERRDAPQETDDQRLMGFAGERTILIPSRTPINEQISLLVSFNPHEIPHSDAAAYLNVPVDAQVSVRTRRERDYLSPLGMNGHRKQVKTWMIDHKVPAQFRHRIPLIIVNEAIAAIMWGDQWVIDERFAVRGTPDERIVYFWIINSP